MTDTCSHPPSLKNINLKYSTPGLHSRQQHVSPGVALHYLTAYNSDIETKMN